jgi:hypothetical protein
VFAANENLQKSPVLNTNLFFLVPKLANLISVMCNLLDNLSLDKMVLLLQLTSPLHLDKFSSSLKVECSDGRLPSSSSK